MRRILIVLLLILVLLGVWGCGRHKPQIKDEIEGYGSIEIAVNWPVVSAQRIPENTFSIGIDVYYNGVKATKNIYINRPEIATTTTTTITRLPCGEATVKARAYSGTGGRGGILAYGETEVTVKPSEVAEAHITLEPVVIEPMLSGGGYHSLALKADGTVWAWGGNGSGQLGNGNTANQYSPVQVEGLDDVKAIAAGFDHSLALKLDGTVWAWGDNEYGQLGDGSNNNSNTPVQVVGLSSVVAIAAGSFHSLALRADGTVWAWGRNNYGQLGDGSTSNSNTPVQVSSLNGITAIAAGGRNFYVSSHSLALQDNGVLWAWGNNYRGQLGDGTNSDSPVPVQVSSLTSVTDLAAGGFHSLALLNDGSVWAWGHNFSGQLGNNTTTDSNIPVQVHNLTNVTRIDAGVFYSLALLSDGTVWTWGDGQYGQLGDGSWTEKKVPVQVSLTGCINAASGGWHGLALKSDGTVWTWGSNSGGKLGDGTTANRNSPVQVDGLNLLD